MKKLLILVLFLSVVLSSQTLVITLPENKEIVFKKELIKVMDILGRETKQTNQPLLYLYDDGTVEKRIIIE